MSQTAVEYTAASGSYPWQNGQPWYFTFVHGNGSGTYGTGIGLLAAPVIRFNGSFANYQQPPTGNPIFTQDNSFDPATSITNIGSVVWTDPQDHSKQAIFLIYENNAVNNNVNSLNLGLASIFIHTELQEETLCHSFRSP